MSFASDLKILYHMALRPIRGDNHADRMDNFYSGQADAYDDFRERLLKGRRELWQSIEVPENGHWVDMGGGTGSNLDYFGDSIKRLDRIYVVDLARSLLEVARRRASDKGWSHVDIVQDDATQFQPPAGPVDVVTFSYSLTMIPNWFSAVDNAFQMLRPGGILGVVDFFVSRKHPANNFQRHSWFTRHFWPIWMSSDNVFPSSEHVPFLHSRFESMIFQQKRAKIPYLPFLRIPYYIFVGRKPV
ncbi:MAG: SAM-dependent methyltransferase [Planctomycetaceae bacterium]|nr:SAM-dependent methyltransferase [Planctomycetaceae bacterium]MBP61053.1 SAM-dependent methyltransferase [Planctomycetaceae bacterium]